MRHPTSSNKSSDLGPDLDVRQSGSARQRTDHKIMSREIGQRRADTFTDLA